MIATRLAFLVLAALPSALGHSAFFHPSIWGFNVSSPEPDFSYDNRAVRLTRLYPPIVLTTTIRSHHSLT